LLDLSFATCFAIIFSISTRLKFPFSTTMYPVFSRHDLGRDATCLEVKLIESVREAASSSPSLGESTATDLEVLLPWRLLLLRSILAVQTTIFPGCFNFDQQW